MVKPVPDGYHTVTPYLVVPSVRGEIAFLTKAFGAETTEQLETGGEEPGHAEVEIGDSIVMIGLARDRNPASSSMFYLYVEDCDALYARAVAAGATSVKEPFETFYGDRNGAVADPFGNQWWLATHVEDVSPEEMERRAQNAWQKEVSPE